MNTHINPYRPAIIRAELTRFLSQPRFSHAVTLIPNRSDLHLGTLEKWFKEFCMEVDRQLLGLPRPHLVPSGERFLAIAMPEKLFTNAHLHLTADLHAARGRGMTEQEIARTMWMIWRKITKGSGDVHVELILDDGWADYITKEVRSSDHLFFLSTDFHRN